MLNRSKNILLASVVLMALAGPSARVANPADQGRALMAEQVQEQVNINRA